MVKKKTQTYYSQQIQMHRVGVAVENLEYELLTGKQRRLKENDTLLKTIVISEMGRDIAAAHDIETIDTLTGFKYISAWIKRFEETGDRSFLFGYEESYGYLISDFVRDKDAVQTCLLIAEVAAYYKSNNMSLYDGLMELYETYGYYREDLESLTLKGKDGAEQIATILSDFRNNAPSEIAGKKVLVIEDYQDSMRTYTESGEKEEITLPQSNVIKYKLENGAWVCLRPSGTEPKIKFYFGVKERAMEESVTVLEGIKDNVMKRVKDVI